MPPSELQSQFPVFKRLVSSYRAHGYEMTEALAEAALTFSTGLGFLTFRDYLAAAAEHMGGDWDEVSAELLGRFIAHRK